MIFSTDACPLCNSKLVLEIIGASNGVAFLYRCTDKKEVVRNEANTFAVASCHYENRCYQSSELCFMIIPPFELMHSSRRKITSVRKVSAHEPKSIIFEVPLLDGDYSQPHAVLNRLKLLVTFS